jgi:hypothetical protein
VVRVRVAICLIIKQTKIRISKKIHVTAALSPRTVHRPLPGMGDDESKTVQRSWLTLSL